VLIAGDALVRGGGSMSAPSGHDSGIDIVVRARAAGSCSTRSSSRCWSATVAEDTIAPRAAAAWLVHCLATEAAARCEVMDEEPGVLPAGRRASRLTCKAFAALISINAHDHRHALAQS
jgi:histidine phosphotransferase ChpT